MTTIDPNAIYTVNEVAKLIRRGETFVRVLVKENRIGHYRPSKGTILISGKDVASWLAGNYVKSADTPSCEPSETGTPPTGTSTPSEKLAASAARSVLTPVNQ